MWRRRQRRRAGCFACRVAARNTASEGEGQCRSLLRASLIHGCEHRVGRDECGEGCAWFDLGVLAVLERREKSCSRCLTFFGFGATKLDHSAVHINGINLENEIARTSPTAVLST